MDPTMHIPLDQLPPEAFEWNGEHMIWTSGVAIGFMLFIPALRVYGKHFLTKKMLGVDDYLMISGCILGIAYASLMLVVFTHGGGHHYHVISRKNLPIHSASIWASYPLFISSITLIKLSILAIYWNLSFPGSLFRRSVIIIGVIISTISVALIFVLMFACQPIERGYNPLIPGRCMDLVPYYFAQAALMVLTDLTVYILPIPKIMKLNLPLRQKLSVCGLFALGGLAVGAGVVKLIQMPKLIASNDMSWTATTSLMWLNIELAAAVLAGSGPALKIIIRHWFPSWGFGSSNTPDEPPDAQELSKRQRKWLSARGFGDMDIDDEDAEDAAGSSTSLTKWFKKGEKKGCEERCPEGS